MAESPENSPPAPTSDSSSSAPPLSSSTSAPPSNDNSASPPTSPNNQNSNPPSPTPPAKQTAPPPSQKNSAQPPPQQNSSPPPPPQNSSPPPPQPNDSSSGTPPPPDSSSNQSPPKSPSPPQQVSNDKEGGGGSSSNNNNNNNNNGNSYNGDNNKGKNDGFPPQSPPPVQKNSGHDHPSPRALGPPSNGGSKTSKNDDTPNIPGIIGVVFGAGLLIVVMMLLCVCCKKKKKKPKVDHNHMKYYPNNSPFGGGAAAGGYYSNNTPQQQYQRDHIVNLSSPSSVPSNWAPPQPPPVPPISGFQASSGEVSSSNISGQHGLSLPPLPHSSVALGFNNDTFTYDELAIATQGFSRSNLLGQGGFGYVHKGILPNGKEIAVKSLKSGSGQGEREFQAEVDIISRVHHRHLVSLVGYCIAEGQRMLVYEFMPNNTLEFHLHGKDRPVMTWPIRMKIALGSAKGLAYLHEDCHPRIIHRDIKAANILLDFSCEVKVADFGLAKLSQDNFTHVSTRVMGTFGYLAPEYASSGKLTDKSDVFSFGVMLLELITGRRPVDLSGEHDESLVDWARPICLKAAEDGDHSELVDPRLGNNYDQHEMTRMAACAAAAIRHSARRRPKMRQIVRTLEGDASLEDLNEGIKPGQSTIMEGSSTVSSEYDASSYSADMRGFRKLVLNSQEYPTSEFGATSEYGLNPSSSSSEESARGDRKHNHT